MEHLESFNLPLPENSGRDPESEAGRYHSYCPECEREIEFTAADDAQAELESVRLHLEQSPNCHPQADPAVDRIPEAKEI